MAKVSNVNTRIWVDEFDLSGFLNSGALDLRQMLPRVEGFSDVGPRRVVADYDHSHKHTGLFDGVDNQVDEILQGLLGTDAEHYLTQAFGANAEGSVCYDAVVKVAGRPHKGASGQAILLDFDAEGHGLSRGLVLANVSVTVAGARTGRNQGATVAGQVYQTVIRIISGTFTSITIAIQESQNDGSPDVYANIAGLSQTFTAAGKARLTTTAATEAWKRVNVSAFTGTSALIVVTGGVLAGSS